jgi:hypothetical protein
MAMQTAHEFMDCFLREQADWLQNQFRQGVPFHEKYYSQSFLDRYHQFHAFETQNPEALVTLDVSGESAMAITKKTLSGSEQRYRYHLVLSGQSWRIRNVGWRCHLCQGTGRFGGAVCDSCNGEGWQDGK